MSVEIENTVPDISRIIIQILIREHTLPLDTLHRLERSSKETYLLVHPQIYRHYLVFRKHLVKFSWSVYRRFMSPIYYDKTTYKFYDRDNILYIPNYGIGLGDPSDFRPGFLENNRVAVRNVKLWCRYPEKFYVNFHVGGNTIHFMEYPKSMFRNIYSTDHTKIKPPDVILLPHDPSAVEYAYNAPLLDLYYINLNLPTMINPLPITEGVVDMNHIRIIVCNKMEETFHPETGVHDIALTTDLGFILNFIWRIQIEYCYTEATPHNSLSRYTYRDTMVPNECVYKRRLIKLKSID